MFPPPVMICTADVDETGQSRLLQRQSKAREPSGSVRQNRAETAETEKIQNIKVPEHTNNDVCGA